MTLQAALEEARKAYAARNPNSLSAYEQAVQALPGGGTRTTLACDPFPLYIASGQGGTLTDVDGHVYKDFLSDYTSGIYGKTHPHIHAAISEALARGLQFGGHTLAEAKLASGLVARFPSLELVRFANSGTEANLLAITTAFKHTKRKKIVVFEGAYHGSLLCHFHAGEPEDVPGVLRPPFDFVIAPYNDLAGTEAVIAPVQNQVGAILVEPMLGAGGCIPAQPEFLAGLRELATRIGAVLIFDEVQTARLSTGGRQKLLGITPDMTTVGKFFGGGFAFGAFGGKKEIMGMFDVRNPNAISHGGTFNNAPLTMVAGAAALDVLTEDVLKELNARGDRMRDALSAALTASGAPFYITGIGSINQLHCTLPKDQRNPAHDLLFFSLLERGFWIAQRGTICLSLANTDADVDEFVLAVADAVQAVKAAVGNN